MSAFDPTPEGFEQMASWLRCDPAPKVCSLHRREAERIQEALRAAAGLAREVAELRTRLAAQDAELAELRKDAALGKWAHENMEKAGPIKTVSGKDVYSVILPPVDRDAGVSASIDAAIAQQKQSKQT